MGWRYTTLTYSFPNLELVHCFTFDINCCFLTCTWFSQEVGKVVWYSHLLKNFPQFAVIHTVKDFSVVNEAELDVFFLKSLCFFYAPKDANNLTSCSSSFSKSSLNVWKFLVHVLLKPSLENFEHHFDSVWNQFNWVWKENWPFRVLWPLLNFPKQNPRPTKIF